MGSALLKESVNSSVGDDDKIYFFFTERSQEQMAYPSQTRVARVARICKVGLKGDMCYGIRGWWRGKVEKRLNGCNGMNVTVSNTRNLKITCVT